MATNLATVNLRYQEIDKRISQANGRLRFANIAVRVERRGGTLSLRSRLPGSTNRQYISLGAKATPAGLQYAERRARELANDIDAGRFDLADWQRQDDSESESGMLASEWVKRFEQYYWSRRDRNSQSETTWRTDYHATFKKLPNAPLSPEQLISVVEATAADSRDRKRTTQVLMRLAKFAEIQVDLSHLTGSYSPRRVNPRTLPLDSAIAQVRDGLQHEGWRWILGMIACYGLRPHEVFLVDLADFPVVQVSDENKTRTGRFVYPLYPEWAERWRLDEVKLPNLQRLDEMSNEKRGTKISGEFYDRRMPFRPYDLRHCYARRCFEFSLPPDLAAGLMGHSIQVHIQTYRAWIDRATYRRAYDALINRGDRPLAPTSQRLE